MAVTTGRTSKADSTSTLRVGAQAPDIDLPTHRGSGERWKLSDMRGKKNVVLAFYPFAFTPV